MRRPHLGLRSSAEAHREAPGEFAVSSLIHSAEAPARPPTGTARDGVTDRRGTLDPHREARVPPTSFLRVAIVILFLVRVRRRIHVSLGRVTERFGLALCAFSVSCTAVKSTAGRAGEDDSDVAWSLSPYRSSPSSRTSPHGRILEQREAQFS